MRTVFRRIRSPRPRPLILVYHRIAEEPIDFWRLTVSPVNFEDHLEVLRRTRHPLPLSMFVSNLLNGTLRPDAIAVTFDDGYADNLLAGKPRLADADLPATVFLATGYIGSAEAFWWDELSRLILLGGGPQRFDLTLSRETILVDFGSELPANKNGTTPFASLEKRRAALSILRQALRLLDQEQRRIVMSELRTIFGNPDFRADLGRAMTGAEVEELTADGLVTIGAHTVTHPVLPALTVPACAREITESKLACEALIGAPVTSFAYPYGEFDSASINEVKKAGFTFACSAQYGSVYATSAAFALPRVYAPNVDGDAFERELHSTSTVG